MFYVFLVGGAIVTLARVVEIFFVADKHFDNTRATSVMDIFRRTFYFRPGVPKFKISHLFPALIGIQFVCAITYIPNELSLKLTFILQIVANLISSLIIDHFGHNGMPVSPINWVKVVGILTAIGGAIMAVVSQVVDNPPDSSAGMTVLFIILALISGWLLPYQTTINIQISSETGPTTSSLMAMVLMYVYAIPITFLMSVIYSLADPEVFYNLNDSVQLVPDWAWVTCLVGAAFVTLGLYVCPALGTAVWMSLMLAGQLISSLIADDQNLFGLGRSAAEPVGIVGIIVVIIGVVVLQLGGWLNEKRKQAAKSAAGSDQELELGAAETGNSTPETPKEDAVNDALVVLESK